MRHFFAYGTLQLPAVMLAVTGRRYAAFPARLEGYARRRLRDKSYPGIRPADAAAVDGLLYLDLDDDALQKLDAFEDAFYHRTSVQVSAARLDWPAQAYVLRKEAYGLLLPEEWQLADFAQHDLTRFLREHA